ncbi:hypothetical protein HD554DRAFT_168755 [Boletus coccyginus]|nr:hypothetical protein HD554DRAFT_168755 [Boletus coccyginus]
MSDWFRFLPHGIDAIANAVKVCPTRYLDTPAHHFSAESSFSKSRLLPSCDIIGISACSFPRLAIDYETSAGRCETLRRELYLSRSRGLVTNQTLEPSAHLNHNGKRPMAEMRGSAKTNSSPRSVPTPVGPLRLTLPPGEYLSFSRQEPSEPEFANTVDRPGSSRFAEQYAYHGEDNPRVRPPQPTDEQQAASVRQPRLLNTNHGMMAPPPVPSQGKRFKLAIGQVPPQADQGIGISTSQDHAPQQITSIFERMAPTPQRPFSAALQMPPRVPAQSASSTLQTNRFIPSSSHGRTFSGLRPAVTSTGMTAAGSAGVASGGNRMPFMPQGSNGFG